jgi:hypothetical protein
LLSDESFGLLVLENKDLWCFCASAITVSSIPPVEPYHYKGVEPTAVAVRPVATKSFASLSSQQVTPGDARSVVPPVSKYTPKHRKGRNASAPCWSKAALNQFNILLCLEVVEQDRKANAGRFDEEAYMNQVTESKRNKTKRLENEIYNQRKNAESITVDIDLELI